ncbi:hypothetical protein ACQKFO_21805 [Rossellomorea sp. NPDC071047]|uniref:hypothetical protein n=1 Tax=Rossellomorea sp. NPDC071047 TaxID=3390675 RepID=UPI003D0201B2
MTLKKFNFETESDFIFYLKNLLILSFRNINIYETHIRELEQHIEEKKLVERPKRVVSSKTYEDFKARLTNTHSYILNLFGDQSELGTSYQNYRKAAKKKKISLLDLSDEQQSELNDITTSRDWSSHIPASLLNSSKERRSNLEIRGPISLPEFTKYRGIWLVSLYEDSYRNLQDFKGIMDLLKQEYEALTGEPCIISTFNMEVREIDELSIPKLSWLIQDKKIKTIADLKKHWEVD